MVKLLLKKNKSERVAVTLPQTGEKGTAVPILNKDKGGQIELMDFTREKRFDMILNCEKKFLK